MAITKPWERPDEPIVFQFTHPGAEHDKYEKIGKDKLLLKPWNTQKVGSSTSHRRKYICSEGEYITKGKQEKSLLDFWGEWEPDSIAIPFNEADDKEADDKDWLPKYSNKPFYMGLKDTYGYSNETPLNKKISSIKNKQASSIGMDVYYQNTDPFVFGDRFIYSSICKPYATLNIKPGSIILFGSTHNYDGEMRYRVDTVFVVKVIIDLVTDKNGNYIFDEYKDGDKDIHYNTTLKHLDPNDPFSHKIFIGATPQDPVEGMYSFIPAHVSDGKTNRERYGTLVIDTDFEKYKKIKDTVQWQGCISCIGKDEVTDFWIALKEYTESKGYVPAVKINLPPTFDSIDELSSWIDSIDTGN